MNAPSPVGPLQVSEIILRTARYDDMKDWYRTFFGGHEPGFETATGGRMKSAPHVDRACFLRIHMAYPYSQVLGLFEVPDAVAAPGMAAGMDHMQFREESLERLFQRFDYLKARNVLPTHTYDHGPSTSFYYADPDGNVVELSAANFADEADYLAYMQSAAFKRNPEGTPVDPQRYIAQHRRQRKAAAPAR